MKQKPVLILLSAIFVLSCMISLPLNAESKLKLSDLSVSITDVQYGLPFMMITPIHPGIEIGTTILKKESENVNHALNAQLGYYYHNIIAHGFYLTGNYDFQIRIKNTIGINMGVGLGYLHSIYPGQGYSFIPEDEGFDQVVNDKSFVIIDMGIGMSYIKPEKIQPFIYYEFNYFNIWEMSAYLRSSAILKLGVKINL